jgi:hypothetical protein
VCKYTLIGHTWCIFHILCAYYLIAPGKACITLHNVLCVPLTALALCDVYSSINEIVSEDAKYEGS